MQLDLITIVAALAAVAVGLGALWSNPARQTNRLFFTLSIHVVFWLFSLWMVNAGGSVNAVFWIRTTTGIGGLVPIHAWLVKETIGNRLNLRDRKWLGRLIGWCIGSAILTALCYTQSFIPSYSTVVQHVRGWAFYTHAAVSFGLWVLIGGECYNEIRRSTGVKRIELQVWLIAVCGTAISIVLLMGLSGISARFHYTRIQPLMVSVLLHGDSFGDYDAPNI